MKYLVYLFLLLPFSLFAFSISADEVLGESEHIELIGDVQIENQGMMIHGDYAFLKSQSDSSKTLSWLTVKDNVQTTLPNQSSVKCKKIEVDFTQGRAQLFGPFIKYSDENGTLWADQGLVFFDSTSHVVQKVQLSKNVRWADSARLHFALADFLDLLPLKKELTMRASEGSHVLYIDTEHACEIAAPLVRAQGENFFEEVEAKGAVRLEFSGEEWEELRRRFDRETTFFNRG